MLGHVEWRSKELETELSEVAEITHCVFDNGTYNILFSNKEEWSEGRFSFTVNPGEQRNQGFYSVREGYEGTADVVGMLSKDEGIVHFSGIWNDKNDTTGKWDFFVEIEQEQMPEQQTEWTFDWSKMDEEQLNKSDKKKSDDSDSEGPESVEPNNKK